MKAVLSIAIGLILLPSLCASQTRIKRPIRLSGHQVKARREAKFLYAIEKGDVTVFYSLLKLGVNVNARRYNRTTALMIAAMNQRPEFLAVLLSKGAQVNAKNKFGNTALMDAAASGQVEMVKWLLAAGANVKARNESGHTAIMFAIKSAYANQENYLKVIELLKSHVSKQGAKPRRAQQAPGADSP